MTSAPTTLTPTHTTAARKRVAVVLGSIMVLTLAVMVLRLLVGESFGWPEGGAILSIRLKRLVLGAVVGMSLAISGVALQALLRNPLAEPFILGLSTGAGVGVMLQLLLGFTLGITLGGTHIGALAGALASMSVVFMAGRKRGVIDPLGLLLVGVVLSTINGAIIMLLNYASGPAGLREDLMRWMMGYLNESTSSQNMIAASVISVAGLAILTWRGRAMDVMSFSDTEAQSLGVAMHRLRMVLFLVASLLAAASVVLAGPIAFVGLICPHIARLLLGPAHRPLVIASALLGIVLVLCSDMLSVSLDWVLHWGRMPVGVFTSLLGGPFFLWMLRPQLGRGMDS